jgi:CBS domain-containing protein
LNDALTRRVIQLNLDNHNFDGIEWAWLAFGSEGRDEQTFSTDQDNGIVFAPPEGASIDALKQRFLAYALDVNKDLDRCGFPLCKGNIMASNPQWCLTLDEWKDQFSTWIRIPQPDALLNATIFFDFRPLFGQAELADAMRRHLLAQTAVNPMFLRAMAKNALDVEPPLGKIRDFLTDLEPGHPGKIDLKNMARESLSTSPASTRWQVGFTIPTRSSACGYRRSACPFAAKKSMPCLRE